MRRAGRAGVARSVVRRRRVWVDLAAPTPEEGRILADVFHFHPLSVEDALSALQFPKIEPYQGYLYLVLHGIDVQKSGDRVATRDIDFFLGPNYLVTVHDGHSRSITRLRELCDRTRPHPRGRAGRASCTASSTRWWTTTVP